MTTAKTPTPITDAAITTILWGGAPLKIVTPEKMAALELKLAEAQQKIDESSANCPKCGRHDFALFAPPIAENRELKKQLAEADEKLKAWELLKRCAESLEHGIVGIASPMSGEKVVSNLPSKKNQGWVVGKIGRPSNFDVEAPTLEAAVTQFAAKLGVE